MAVSDNRQKIMPFDTDRDITKGRASPLAYKEAVHLINPQNHMLKGQVLHIILFIYDKILIHH